MREIKYRCYHPELNIMEEVTLIDFENKEIYVMQNDLCFDLNEVKLTQYTNQKNHKGLEIYEGDYVSKELNNGFDYGTFEGVVKMINGCWVIENGNDYYEELFSEFEEIEVLGNIYENQELLNG